VKPQRHWDARAALNFIGGGAGAGLVIASVLLPDPRAAVVLATALIGAGLFAVWLETGRRLRALHVLFNPFTSWMTREAFAALLLFPLAFGTILTGRFVTAAAIAAAAFLYCQARILRAARGIPAWRAPQVVPLVVTTGLVEGAGLCLFFGAAAPAVGLFAFLVVLRGLAWSSYRSQVHIGKVQLGTVAVLAFAAASWYVAELALVGAALAIAGGWWLKLALVTRASPEGFVLPRIPVRGTR
jgi:phenylacetyl-CoA:acceptor oxidoreductase subunit 2